MNIVIGHVALIQRTKKQDFVLHVIHELRKRGNDVIGLFPGECRESEYLRELEKLTKELELTDSVLFLGRRNDIPDLLKLFDVLIIPSAFEGFPLAGLEAASAGVPVAACDVAGAKEFVEASGGGCVFENDNIVAAVEAIIGIVEQKSNISQLGIVFAKNCSVKSYSQSLSKVFKAIALKG